MATDHRRTKAFIERTRRDETGPAGNAIGQPLPPSNLHADRAVNSNAVAARFDAAAATETVRAELFDEVTVSNAERYEGFIEGFVGTAKVPVGLVGPLLVNRPRCSSARYIPLATSEAALVASYQRGARTITRSGGATAMLLAESVIRSPCFVFERAEHAARFLAWLSGAFDEIRATAEATSNHAKLLDLRFTLEGNQAFVSFEYSTGDASGQNMTTIATEAACRRIVAASPEAIERWYLESNLSGDKKASGQSFSLVRGRKVCADAIIPEDVLRSELNIGAEEIEAYWKVSVAGGVLAGTLGVQGHFANGLAALSIATGQDAACVAESAVGMTRLEARTDRSLYASVTLPNLMLGTVGGGTSLPSATACLELMGIKGDDGAAELAEVTGALLLAGEISLIAAIASGDFGRAHRVLRRSDRRARKDSGRDG
ncbi:MAG: hydroxymethylglutaryl-CoA reductase [Planctomycetota bacterium]